MIASLLARVFGSKENSNLTETQLLKDNGGTKLVVVMHAFTNDRDDMKHVVDAVVEAHPDADILAPNYNSSLFANTSLPHTAAKLSATIEYYYNESRKSGHEYSEIILVGHSIGALLCRKSYLYGLGIGTDYPYPAFKKQDWVDQTSRIILLAGINRGWNPDKLPLGQKIGGRIASWIASFFGHGKMIHSAERGSPFVTDLNLNWKKASHENLIKAQVIQLLGKDDKIAPLEEQEEILSTPDFIMMNLIQDATHANIIDMDKHSDDISSLRKRSLFIDALTLPEEQLKQAYGSNSYDHLNDLYSDRYTVKHIVMVVHGIRDEGKWIEALEGQLNQSKEASTIIEGGEYGWFPMGRFLLFNEREKWVRWFVDQVAHFSSIYPDAEISFIGHSNGTYLLASALEQYTALRFNNIYFAGSVVRTDFPWDDYLKSSDRVHHFRNDIAVDDWVVAWFPHFYQIIRKQLNLSDDGFFNIGSGGFTGFEQQSGKDNVNYVTGGHGGALKNAESISNFILFNDTEKLTEQSEYNNLMVMSSHLCWIIWFAIISFFLGLGALICKLPFIKNKVIATTVYVFLVIAILLTI